MKGGPLIVLALIGCVPSFEVPDDVRVTCVDDGDCYRGLCATTVGYCVEELDREPVRVLGATAASPASVLIRFDDALDPVTTARLDAYVIEPALTVSFANYDDAERTVLLATSEQAPGVTYTLSVSGITDEQGNGLELDPSTVVFNSFFGGADDAPPRILSPAIESVVRDSDVLLQWTAVAAARSYVVQIGTDPTFVADTASYSVDAPTTELAFAATEDITYYWRVRADLTAAGIWSEARFNRLGSVIFVGCGQATCPGGVGNRTKPIGSLIDAVSLARGSGISELRLRGDADFQGPLLGDGYAMTVRGGYDADFESRDMIGKPSRITGLGSAAIISETVDTVRFEGLVLTASAISNTAVLQIRNTYRVELDHVLVRSEGDSPSKTLSVVGVVAECPRGYAQAELVVRDSVIELGSAVDVIGLSTFQVSLDAARTTVRPRVPAADSVNVRNLAIFGGERATVIDDITVIGSGKLVGGSTSTSLGRIGGFASVRNSSFYMPELDTGSERIFWGGIDASTMSGTFESSLVVSDVTVRSGYGVRSVATFGLVFRNNVVAVARGVGYSAEIADIDEPTALQSVPESPSLVDNTIVVDSGIAVKTASPTAIDVTTNLLVAPTCLFEDLPPIDRTLPYFSHNNYYGNVLSCPTVYDDALPSAAITTVAALNAFHGRESNAYGCSPSATCLHQRSELNADATGTIFVRNTGSPSTRDLHIAPSAPDVVKQLTANSTSATACGSIDASQPCNGALVDYDGTTRTVPRSAGAYEF